MPSAALQAIPPHRTGFTDLDLLEPLCQFYPGPSVDLGQRQVPGACLPEPYRRLLVHDSDMTSTLQAFHGERLGLRVLDHYTSGGSLFRQVALFGVDSGKRVEYGAIRIELSFFEPAARERIVSGWQPLGAILAEFQVPYLSRPRRFFEIKADDFVRGALELDEPAVLYGRQNHLLAASGLPLAEVVEILPPTAPH